MHGVIYQYNPLNLLLFLLECEHENGVKITLIRPSKTTGNGSVVLGGTFDAVTKEITVGGTININGEQVVIDIGDTNETVFAKVRDLCSTVDISLQSELAGVATMPFDDGLNLEFTLNK